MNDKWLACILIFFFLTYIFGTYTFDDDLWLFVQMALISAFWCIWHIASGLIIAVVFRNWGTKAAVTFTEQHQ